MRLLVLDNYDSFTYNLVHLLEELNCNDITVCRNDKITVAEAAHFDKILLSPGPGIPEEAGILKPLIQELSTSKSIFGVCLGHQAIAEVFGGTLINLSEVYHGVPSKLEVIQPESTLFKHLPRTFSVGRYHSWAVSKEHFPKELQITAIDKEGEVMALQHKTLSVYGVQFHPESVLTEYGRQLVQNWLNS
jgi:anthranilate synthase component 2